MTKSFGHGRGEGQIIGEITQDNISRSRRRLQTFIPSKKKGLTIEETLNNTIGYESTTKTGDC